MATIALLPADRNFIAGAASGFTRYASYTAARDAALAASVANSNVAYYTAKVIEQFFGPTGKPSLVAGSPGPTAWIIQAASGTTYLPKATAESTAAAASTSTNGYYVARLFQTVTGPA